MKQTSPAVLGPVEPTVRLCRECSHSMPEPESKWNLRCVHPAVNSRDAWALAGSQPHGSNARDERERTLTLSGLAPCGMRGALWEAKNGGLGHTSTAMPMDDGKLREWVRSVMAHGADIWQDYERNRSIRFENYSARLDAAAEARADDLKKLLSLVTEDRDHV